VKTIVIIAQTFLILLLCGVLLLKEEALFQKTAAFTAAKAHTEEMIRTTSGHVDNNYICKLRPSNPK